VLNIERKYFADILAQPRRKKIEYRRMTAYWLRRLERVGPAPFNLRLLNGMRPPVPEATIKIVKVVRSHASKELELHLGRILDVRHWNRAKERPSR
jgi:hypothetical protein